MCVLLGGGGGGFLAVHVHLGLSSRSELILVGAGAEGGREQARGQAGQVWVAGHLSR